MLKIVKDIPVILGLIASVIQLARFWPLSWNTFLASAFMGFVFYKVCSFGRDRGHENLELNWLDWSKNALKGMGLFLLISIAVSLYFHHNPSCIEMGDPIFGGCEEYSDQPTDSEKGISFNLIYKSILPILLCLAYYLGNGTKRKECLAISKDREKQASVLR